MKYHNHYIIKVRSDDYEDNDIKWYYQIYDSRIDEELEENQ